MATDGDVVRWIEVPSGNTEPDHPAPVLKLAKAGADADIQAVSNDGTGEAAAAAGDDSDASDVPLWLGFTGVVLGAMALTVALAAIRKAAA